MRRCVRVALIVLAWLALAPSAAYAQASITGVVRDTSGAVLPGVTVEAASPALIEKVRSVVTDSAGQYRIIDLRPGTYTVTFSLPGFSTVKREGIELAGTFVATVNAELRVGTLEETVTVTGETPVVDVQSARQEEIISRDVIAAVPSGRGYLSLATANPSLVLNRQDVGGTTGPRAIRFTAHGSIITDSRILVDGLSVGSASRGGVAGSYYAPNTSATEEVVVTTSGGLGEADTSGVILNIIPREGGNTTSGTAFGTVATSGMQGDNYTQSLRDQGLRAPNRVSRVWDFNPVVGGPLLRDKLWYLFSARRAVADNFIAGMFHNKNAGDPNAWTYEPDLSRQAIEHGIWWSVGLRLTWQASSRQKLSFLWDEQYRCEGCPAGANPTLAPESRTRSEGIPRVQQATWTAPVTSRVLAEAALGRHWLGGWGGNFKGPDILQRLIPVNEQAGAIPGLTYRAISGRSNNRNNTYNWRASVSYVTGAHHAKVGVSGLLLKYKQRNSYPNGGFGFRFRDGVPNRLTQSVEHAGLTYMQSDGVYAQDRWTIQRLTLQGAVRYDHFRTYFPVETRLGPHAWMPIAFVFPAHTGASFHDVTPRMAAVYDLLGDGKTALKVHAGKYMTGQESDDTGTFGSFMNPIRRLATSTNRSWNDLNRNYLPDCDLGNRAANGECGAMDNQNFGTDVFSMSYDPKVTRGWGVRPYSWEFAVSVQRELVPRVSATVGYFRRWFGNLAVTDNLATTVADYTLFDLPVPVDRGLPRSGGVVRGVATINPDKFGLVNNQVTAARNLGRQIDRWQGADITVDARLQNGLVVQGGASAGSRLLDNCDLAPKLPEVLGALPLEFCRQKQPFQTQVKGLATYTIPLIDVQVSGTWQSIPGPEILANYDVPTTIVASVIGRPLAGGERNQRVGLILPLSRYADRVDQIDFRIAKLLRFGRTRTLVGLDVFNALNSGAVLNQNNTFGSRWLTPTEIITARLAKVAVQLDF